MNNTATEARPTEAEKVARVRDYLAHTTGTENHWQHSLMRGFRYTDGVQFVADTCGAHWLIDLVASYQVKPKVRAQSFQVWRFERTRNGGYVASAWTDTPHQSEQLAIQRMEFSDFPNELLPFDLWVEYGVLLLPAEH